jgi:predicted ester cyclase
MDDSDTMQSAYARINAHDLDGFSALLSDDFVEHEGGPGMPPTKEGTVAFFTMLRSAFPDMQMTPDDLLASGSKTVARVTFTGTHRGEPAGSAS